VNVSFAVCIEFDAVKDCITTAQNVFTLSSLNAKTSMLHDQCCLIHKHEFI